MQDRILAIHTIEPEIADASLPGVSIQEAADTLGVSASTIRRWCVTGRLRSERVTRAQGVTIRVFVDPSHTGDTLATGPDQHVQEGDDADRQFQPGGTQPGGTALELSPSGAAALPSPDSRPLSRISRAEKSRAEMTIALISATASQVVAPFMSEYQAVRETADRQAAQLRSQAELIGRLSSDLDHARETIRQLSQQQSPSGPGRWIPVALMISVFLLCAAVAVGATIASAR